MQEEVPESNDSYRPPEDLVSFLDRETGGLYSQTARFGLENTSLGEHTVRVLRIFDRYLQDRLPASISREAFRSLLALHDSGKPQALQEGQPELHHEYSLTIARPILEKLGVRPSDIAVISSLLAADPIGEYLQKGDALLSAQKIKALALEAKILPEDYWKALLVYYQADAGSYTKQAGSIEFLDAFFVFEPENNIMGFAPAIQEKIDQLKALVDSDKVSPLDTSVEALYRQQELILVHAISGQSRYLEGDSAQILDNLLVNPQCRISCSSVRVGDNNRLTAAAGVVLGAGRIMEVFPENRPNMMEDGKLVDTLTLRTIETTSLADLQSQVQQTISQRTGQWDEWIVDKLRIAGVFIQDKAEIAGETEVLLKRARELKLPVYLVKRGYFFPAVYFNGRIIPGIEPVSAINLPEETFNLDTGQREAILNRFEQNFPFFKAADKDRRDAYKEAMLKARKAALDPEIRKEPHKWIGQQLEEYMKMIQTPFIDAQLAVDMLDLKRYVFWEKVGGSEAELQLAQLLRDGVTQEEFPFQKYKNMDSHLTDDGRWQVTRVELEDYFQTGKISWFI